MGEDWVEGEWKGLDIRGRHNKAGAFYIKKKGDCLLFQWTPLELSVMSLSLQEVRLSLAIPFGTSEAHLRGLKFLPSEHLHQIYGRPHIQGDTW